MKELGSPVTTLERAALPNPTIYSETRRTAARPLVWILYVGAVLLYSVTFYFWQVEPVPAGAHIAGAALAAVCLLPFAIWMGQRSRGLPMFELICLAFLIAYGVPAYLLPNHVLIHSRWVLFDWSVTQLALSLAVLGTGSMVLAFYVTRRSGLGRTLKPMDLPLSPGGKRVYPTIAICTGLGMMLFQSLAGGLLDNAALAAFARLVAGQYAIGLSLLAYRVFGDNRKLSGQCLFLYFAVALGFLLGLIGGMLENAIMPLVLLTIVRWHASGRPPMLWIAAGVALLVILNGVKSEYRQMAWSGSESPGIADKVSLWFRLSGEQMSDAGQDESRSGDESSLSRTIYRLDLLHMLAWATERTPAMVPYYGGETYAYAVTGWIPRFLWPDKPTAQEQNNQMVLDYDLLDKADQSTSIGVGQVAEAYANFGMPGIALIMGILGGVIALIDRTFNGPNSEGGRAVFLAALFPFLNGIGAAAAPQLTGTVLSIVGSVAIIRFAAMGGITRFGTREKRTFAVPDNAG